MDTSTIKDVLIVSVDSCYLIVRIIHCVTEDRVKKVDRERREAARRAREEYRGTMTETIKAQSLVIGMAMSGYKKIHNRHNQNRPPADQK